MCQICEGSSSKNIHYDAKAAGVEDGPFIGCCKIDEGYYCIWDDNHMGMECEDWVELCDMRNVIRQVSHIAFDVVSDRQRARTALNNIKREAPFALCKRFPLGKMYLNLSCSVYSAIMQRILGSLDFKDRETEKEMKFSRKGEQGDADQTARKDYTGDDAKTAFRNSLIILENELCKRNEVFSRWSFEKKYNLSWCKGPCPIPSPGGPGETPPQPPVPPPGQPPTNPPNQPVIGTYGHLMGELRKKGLEPADFKIFNAVDMRKGDFACQRATQGLSSSMETVKFPTGVSKIYVFTDAEYRQCASVVNGHIYTVASGNLTNKLDLKTNSEFSEEDLITALFEKFSKEDLVGLVRRGVKKRWPNSVLVSDSSYEFGDEEEESESGEASEKK